MSTIPSHWIAVKLDQTSYFDEDFLSKCGGKVYEVALVNVALHTYCCESTPSYFCIPVEMAGERLPENDDERDQIFDQLQSFLSDPFYVHCDFIDSLNPDNKVDIPIDLDDLVGDGEDEAMEKYRTNPRW